MSEELTKQILTTTTQSCLTVISVHQFIYSSVLLTHITTKNKKGKKKKEIFYLFLLFHI